jgi:hypothetical protein
MNMQSLDILYPLLPTLKTFNPTLSADEHEAIAIAALCLDDEARDASQNVTAAHIVRQIRQSNLQGGAVVNAIFPAIFGLEGLLPRWMLLTDLLRVAREVSISDSAVHAKALFSQSFLDNHLLIEIRDQSSKGWSLIGRFPDGCLLVKSPVGG